MWQLGTHFFPKEKTNKFFKKKFKKKKKASYVSLAPPLFFLNHDAKICHTTPTLKFIKI
jgi:hypothetical protein